jgi:ActR/RegA family two-component response regulator
MSRLTHKPRILVLTNHGSCAYEGDAITLGAILFLDKPQDFPRLPQILANMVEAIRGQ